MKSRITIEVDFENGNEPVIQIKQYFTDDVRDKLLSSFLQRRAHQSSWLRIDHIAGTDDHNLLRIRALTPEQLPEQSKLMALMSPPQKWDGVQRTFSRTDVIDIIGFLLERMPDEVMDSINNEGTEWMADDLLAEVEKRNSLEPAASEVAQVTGA